MDSRRLRYFTMIFEQGSINQAAARLRVSQPALTQAIRLLEEEYQVTLFERSSRGVKPTAYGRALYAHAKAAASELDQARNEIERIRNKQAGDITIGVTPSVTVGSIGHALVRFGLQNANGSIRVLERTNSELLTGLLLGEFDFTLGVRIEANEELTQTELYTERIVVIASKTNRLAKRKRLSAKQLVDADWIYPIGHGPVRASLERLFISNNLEIPKARLELASLRLVKEAVQNSQALSMLPASAGEAEFSDGSLMILPVEPSDMQVTISIIHRANHPLSRLARSLIRMLRELHLEKV